MLKDKLLNFHNENRSIDNSDVESNESSCRHINIQSVCLVPVTIEPHKILIEYFQLVINLIHPNYLQYRIYNTCMIDKHSFVQQ